MLGTLTGLKTYLRVTDTTQDTALEALLVSADAAAKRWCKRTFEATVTTEHYDGQGTPDVPLRQIPVIAPILSAVAVFGNTTITRLASTAHLLPGMPAINSSYLPYNTVISSVSNATAAVLSAAPNTTGSVAISFGLAVWIDIGGYYGTGPDAFPNTALLREGSDFALLRDEPSQQGWSRSGLIRRLGAGPTGSMSDWPFEWRRGTLTARIAPAWSRGYGNVRVVSCQGYPAGSIPDDLVQAVYQLAAAMRVMAPVGVPLDTPVITEQWVGLLDRMVSGEVPGLTSARVTLRSYRQASF